MKKLELMNIVPFLKELREEIKTDYKTKNYTKWSYQRLPLHFIWSALDTIISVIEKHE